MDQRFKNDNYREQEMRILAEWILAGESGSVVGLSGCGRSNLLLFLCERPDLVQARYLPPNANPIALISVDLNHLPAYDAATLYRVILRSFYWARERFEAPVREKVRVVYAENRAAQDPFLCQSALHEVLFAFQAQRCQVVLVLNHFDRFCEEATLQMQNTLRGLRDSFKDTLCFIAGMCQEVAYLPDPEALGYMYELLDSHVCWVGAMDDADAKQVIAKTTRTATRTPREAEISEMLSLTGNFPALLKAIGYWWLNNNQLPPHEWQAALLREHTFDFRLARLWQGLTQEEQFALSAVREWQDLVAREQAGLDEAQELLKQEHSLLLTRLAGLGLCLQGEHGWQIRGDLLSNHIKRVGPAGRGRIRLDEESGEIYQGLSALRELLTPLEDRLLRFLIENPRRRHLYEDLIVAVWSEERSRNDLFTLVRSLRQKIEVRPSKPSYIMNWKGYREGGLPVLPRRTPAISGFSVNLDRFLSVYIGTSGGKCVILGQDLISEEKIHVKSSYSPVEWLARGGHQVGTGSGADCSALFQQCIG